MPDAPQSGVRLVVGASRGIGLALAEAQLADPSVNRVITTYRPASDRRGLDRLASLHGERLQRIALDVSSDASIDSFSSLLKHVEGGIDIAIHAAGILHENGLQPEKSLADCSVPNLLRMFAVNSIGPLMVARALLETADRQRRFTFAALSAMVGSISDNRLGGWYGYRASKAALNQLIKTLSIECRVKHPQASILAIHPGTTDTGLSRPFQRNVKPGRLYTPRQTADRIIGVIQNTGPADSGRFLNWDGSEIPW
ncbi:MAG: SDR family NAD(P)-dependent oxidoreductase [Xanthomonadales bacterium]|nr:SDR family NAD(P)-dependent oxidoreductase [Xanthomonadales bacterium]